MGIISSRILKTKDVEERSFDDALLGLGGYQTNTGTFISEESALRNTAVYACVGLISSSLAAMPLILYRKDGRERIRAIEHPLYGVLQTIGNREWTAYEVRETRLIHTLLWGNSYSEIEYDDQFNIVGLWPLAPNRVGIERNGKGELEYTYYSDKGQSYVFPNWKILHLRNKVVGGAVGISPIGSAMNALGLAKALEDFGSRYFRNGAKPSVILKHPGKLTPEAYERLRASFSSNWQGIENSHRVQILEEGLTPETIGIPPEEAQFLSTRKFQIAEIARLYQVPLHMLAELDRATFASVEQQGIDYRTFTILPWAKRDEQALMRDLLTKSERETLYIEYLLDGLERADIETRTKAFSTMRQNGIITANEWRERENLNPLPDGDTLWIPLNMTEAGAERSHEHGKLTENRAIEAAKTEVAYKRALTDEEVAQVSKKRKKTIDNTKPAFDDATQRLVNREVADIKRAVKKHLPDDVNGFNEWLENFYDELRNVSPTYLKPVMRVLSSQVLDNVKDEIGEDAPAFEDTEKFIDEYLANFSRDYSRSGVNQLKDVINTAALEQEDVVVKVNERLDEWSETKAEKTSFKEVFEAANALALAAYVFGGVKFVRWSTGGGSCKFCQKLNGRVVEVQAPFVEDETLEDGEGGTMRVYSVHKHPPIHAACSCSIVAS